MDLSARRVILVRKDNPQVKVTARFWEEPSNGRLFRGDNYDQVAYKAMLHALHGDLIQHYTWVSMEVRKSRNDRFEWYANPGYHKPNQQLSMDVS